MVEDLQKALDALEQGNCAMGPHWDIAHDIAQTHEGEPVFDRLHALLHRIEGDSFNANYWYRRAGVTPFSGSFSAELTELKKKL